MCVRVRVYSLYLATIKIRFVLFIPVLNVTYNVTNFRTILLSTVEEGNRSVVGERLAG